MKNIKHLIAILAFVPFVSFAATSVSIDSVIAHPTGVIDVSGSASYDATSTSGVVSTDGASATISSYQWSVSLSGLRLGDHTITAAVGSSIATKNVSIVGDSGGIICHGEKGCGMPMDWNALMAAQKPVEVPHQMTAAEIREKINALEAQVIELLKQEVQLVITLEKLHETLY